MGIDLSSQKRNFIKNFSWFCLTIATGSALIFFLFFRDAYFSLFPLQFLLIAMVTLLSHFKIMNAHAHNARRFGTAFMSTMSLKFLIYIIFLLIGLWIDKRGAVPFVISFLSLYLIFTIYEVRMISNFLRKNPNSSN